MLRPLSLLPALVAATALLVGPGGTAAGAATGTTPTAEGDAPLVLTIDSMTPAVVPERGPIRLTGTVTNRDDSTWSTINLYPFASDVPMTTRAELADAAATDPEALVGERITDPAPYDTIDALAPGATARFDIRLPRSRLDVTEEGVYWFGVHALGESADSGEVRDSNADGRARTFLPLARGQDKPVATALVLPVRRSVHHAADGSLSDLPSWTRTLRSGGALRSRVELGAAAGSRPLTWLVDPAVPAAVSQLVAGNPARSLEPNLEDDVTDPDEEHESPGASESSDPDPTAAATVASGDGEDEGDEGDGAGDEGDGAGEPVEPSPEAVTAAGAADEFLEVLRDALADQPLLTLPFGDVDVAALAEHGPELYDRARARSGETLAPWGLPASPAVAPPSGYLDLTGLRSVARGDTVLLGDQVLPGAESPTVARVAGRRVVLASAGATSGGPGPDDRLAPVTVRQRILAEVVVRRLAPGRRPLVALLPDRWVPHSTAGFFEGLDQPWLDLTDLADATDRRPADVDPTRLLHPDLEEQRELDAPDTEAADSLIRAGTSLQNLLALNTTVAATVADEALTGLSYASRRDVGGARRRADRSRAWIEQRLRSVRVEAPPGVTLSGTNGQFAATFSNALDQPVTVRVQALADGPVEISGPETVELAPESRRSVLLTARADRPGVHNVTLLLTDVDGTALGASDRLPIRTAQVSNVIWVIIGTGGALLFLAIGVRLWRRVRA